MLYLNNKQTSIESLNSQPIFKSIKIINEKKISTLQIVIDSDKGLWGFGERFDNLNQKGLVRENKVFEKFTNQGDKTYLPIPFFLSNDFGIYIDTFEVFNIYSTIKKDKNIISIPSDLNQRDIYIFIGTPKEQLKAFLSLKGDVVVPPIWSFGPWMSANRWNNQELVLEMARKSKALGFFHTVIVVEAWSDEATFYSFNDKSLWPNPKEMIKELKNLGLHLILWQVPVLKKLNNNEHNQLHEKDCEYAINNNLVVKKSDGSVYTIPKDRWFEESMIPDFTNPETKKWWFNKRQYLLDMGVDGFKTDGGEFIYDDDIIFFDGSTGKEMRNKYPLSYTQAYYEALGKDKVLFSRSGYTSSWQTPIHWAGDQMSTFKELKHQLIAGLNASVSGIFFWSFDIAGFAGEMPSKELYLRAFSLGTFSPIMQWHSEPLGGQFSKIMKSKDAINDRSPWNIAKIYNDDNILEITKSFTTLREKIIPYLYEEALYSKDNCVALMKPLFYSHPKDKNVFDIEDEFYLGRSLLVAPIVNENQVERSIYIPEGNWFDCQLKIKIEGKSYIQRKYSLAEIGLFINLDTNYSKLKNILI
ncbi:MAG: glycoside hydrolase [Sphaerochaetaceae bacterium]|nr:glycoside hydrolase [Sphaerochaetaceae bacterium]